MGDYASFLNLVEKLKLFQLNVHLIHNFTEKYRQGGKLRSYMTAILWWYQLRFLKKSKIP